MLSPWAGRECVSLFRRERLLQIVLKLSPAHNIMTLTYLYPGAIRICLGKSWPLFPNHSLIFARVIMAAARHNRPFLMIYGGTIRKGTSKLLNKDINISSCYEASGAFIYGKLHAAENPGEPGRTPDDVMNDLEEHACPGPGACGGMYTANTMSTAIESMGLWFVFSNLYCLPQRSHAMVNCRESSDLS
jgi:hypothetical protein